MTALSHLDPNFSTVAGIQAINEPIMDASKTPGLGECASTLYSTPTVVQFFKTMTYIDEKNFVQTVRAVERSLGISDPLSDLFPTFDIGSPLNVTQAISTTATLSSLLSFDVCKVLQEAAPIIFQIALDLEINLVFGNDGLGSFLSTRRPLVTKYVLNSEFVSIQRVDTILQQLHGYELAIQ